MRIRHLLDNAAKAESAFRSVAAVGNVGAGEDDLMTTTIAGSLFSEAGDYIRIVAWGTSANNVNAKTLKLYFGGVAIASQSLTISIAGRWRIEAMVDRTGQDTQDAVAVITEGTAVLAAGKIAQEFTALTQDEEAVLTVKCTGTGVADNDIVQEGMSVEPFFYARG